MRRMKIFFKILLASVVLLAIGCSGAIKTGTWDPETGEQLDSRVYVDEAGWSFDHVGAVEEAHARYWEYYDHMKAGDDGTPIPGWLNEIWNEKRSTGMFSVHVAVDKGGRSNFLAMTLDIPLGMSLYWTEEALISLYTISGDDTTQYDSQIIYFSKDEQRRVYSPSHSSVVMANDGSWDTGQWNRGRGRILATIQFPFDGKFPDQIVRCKVRGVKVLDATFSSSD